MAGKSGSADGHERWSQVAPMSRRAAEGMLATGSRTRRVEARARESAPTTTRRKMSGADTTPAPSGPTVRPPCAPLGRHPGDPADARLH